MCTRVACPVRYLMNYSITEGKQKFPVLCKTTSSLIQVLIKRALHSYPVVVRNNNATFRCLPLPGLPYFVWTDILPVYRIWESFTTRSLKMQKSLWSIMYPCTSHTVLCYLLGTRPVHFLSSHNFAHSMNSAPSWRGLTDRKL